ncbi:MAG: hypothetical protein WCK75_06195 [Elusimicrobiota bacterium]
MKNAVIRNILFCLCFALIIPAAASDAFLSGAAADSINELAALKACDLSRTVNAEAFPTPVPAKPETALTPVVVTVPGIKFNKIGWGPLNIIGLNNFLASFFKSRDPLEKQAVEITFGEAEWQDEMHTQAETDAETLEADPLTANYLELKLMAMPEYAAHKPTIIPFAWSMDPADTASTIPALADSLAKIYDTYKNTGRPIFIFAHSWGTVLSHEALHRLEKTRPDIRIDKFITTGSPLVPGNLFMKMFVNMEKIKEGLLKKISKPANVRYWNNIWSSRDVFANAIPAADNNLQIDAPIGAVEPVLINLILRDKRLAPQARIDLLNVRHVVIWHRSYFSDFKVTLKSINKDIDLRVFRPVVASHVLNMPLN